MPKPIGNLVASLKTNDKVSYKTKAKFSIQSPLLAPHQAAKPAEPPKKAVKYKSRKK